MINSVSYGDLARTFALQRSSADLKSEMDRLNTELVTGRVSDPKSVLAGNVAYLASIENDRRILDGFNVATIEAQTFADTMQTSLEVIQTGSTTFAQDLLAISQNVAAPILGQYAVDAKTELESVVSALNATSAGRSIFAGTATNTAAIASVDEILNELRTVMAAETSVGDMIAAADAWLADPAGYSDTVYLGSDNALQPFRIGVDQTVDISFTANDPNLREVVKGLALAALADDPALGLTTGDQRTLYNNVGLDLLASQDAVTSVRADVGLSQERIDRIATRNAAEKLSLDYATGELLEADPYETATRLEEVQFQLQSLYTITARMSDLSLLNFLR